MSDEFLKVREYTKDERYQLGRLKDEKLLTKEEVLNRIKNAFYFENEIVTSSDIFRGIKRDQSTMGRPVLEKDFLKFFLLLFIGFLSLWSTSLVDFLPFSTLRLAVFLDALLLIWVGLPW